MLRWTFQAVFLVAVVAFLLFLFDNLVYQPRAPRHTDRASTTCASRRASRSRTRTSARPRACSTRSWSASSNTIRVALLGIVLATIVGVIVGVARLSSNWLVRKVAALYVETLRNIPVLVIILFLYLGVMIRLPPIREGVELLELLRSRTAGSSCPGSTRSARAVAFGLVALVGLAVAARCLDLANASLRRAPASRTTASCGRRRLPPDPRRRATSRTGRAVDARHARDRRALDERRLPAVARVRRAPDRARRSTPPATSPRSCAAASWPCRGARARPPTRSGSRGFQRLRFVVLPQAFRIAIPPIANQYLNLTKNSSLGVAIGYSEVTRVTQVSIAQGAPALQAIVVLMGIYLVLSLCRSRSSTNLVNRRLTLRGRR